MQSIRLNYTQLDTGAYGAFVRHFCNFCKNKIDHGWLAEREDPEKLKESLIHIATIVNRSYNKLWCLYQNERTKVTNNLRELFPGTKG